MRQVHDASPRLSSVAGFRPAAPLIDPEGVALGDVWREPVIGGEDPAYPGVRDALENAKAIIQVAVSQLDEMQIATELTGPDDDDRAPVRRLLDQAVGRVTGW